MTTIAEKIAAGAVLVATPSSDYGRSWRYTLDKVAVILRDEDMVAVLRSSLISVERLAGNKLRYYRTTPAERKERRAAYRKWKQARGVK